MVLLLAGWISAKLGRYNRSGNAAEVHAISRLIAARGNAAMSYTLFSFVWFIWIKAELLAEGWN